MSQIVSSKQLLGCSKPLHTCCCHLQSLKFVISFIASSRALLMWPEMERVPSPFCMTWCVATVLASGCSPSHAKVMAPFPWSNQQGSTWVHLSTRKGPSLPDNAQCAMQHTETTRALLTCLNDHALGGAVFWDVWISSMLMWSSLCLHNAVL